MNDFQLRPRARHSDLVMTELGDEILIYDTRTDTAFCLNPAAALVWQNCDGAQTVSEIAERVGENLKTAVNEDFVHFALRELSAKNLVEAGESLKNESGRLSRREAVRRIGLGTAATLPVVSALIAPQAALAQSCIGVAQPCTLTSQCCPGAGVVCGGGGLGGILRCCNPSTGICATPVQCCGSNCVVPPFAALGTCVG